MFNVQKDIIHMLHLAGRSHMTSCILNIVLQYYDVYMY